MALVNPYVLLGLLVALLAAATSSFFYGQHLGHVACQAAQVQAVNDVIKQKDAELAQAAASSQKLEASNALSREANRILNDRLNSVAARPLYTAQCLDAAGLSLVNAALTGSASTPR